MLTAALVAQAFFWSRTFGHPLGGCVINAMLTMFAAAVLLRLHRRWALEPVISRRQWLVLLNVTLVAVSLVHRHWLHEGIPGIDWGVGPSDGVKALDLVRSGQEIGLWAIVREQSGNLVGYAAVLYPLMWAAGLENFYAIALMNVVLLGLAALGVAVVLAQVPMPRRSVPIWLFLLHPFSIVYAATIYKDPLVVCGSVLVFAALVLELRSETSAVRPRPTALLVAGLIIALIGRLQFAVILFVLVVISWLLRSRRFRTARKWSMRNVAVAAVVLLALLVLVRNTALINTLQVTTVQAFRGAGEVTSSDESSLGARYTSGSLVSRLPTLPLQIAFQLVSPFPPRFGDSPFIYYNVENTFGFINITLAPFIAFGVVAAWRSRLWALRLTTVFALFLVLPVVAYGGVVTRQLFPVIPFLMVLAWVGWRRTPAGLGRMLMTLTIPLVWAISYAAYSMLKD